MTHLLSSLHFSLRTASGMSKEQYRKLKEQERNANQGKNLGKVGITTFKSRSFVDWQKAGGRNLFPVDPTKVKDPKEIPYMYVLVSTTCIGHGVLLSFFMILTLFASRSIYDRQRPGGKPDDSDLKKPSAFGGMFGFGKQKQEAEPEPEQKSTNWWTLN